MQCVNLALPVTYVSDASNPLSPDTLSVTSGVRIFGSVMNPNRSTHSSRPKQLDKKRGDSKSETEAGNLNVEMI